MFVFIPLSTDSLLSFNLELASSLDTDAFLNAFVRMTGRRGWPQQMLSDNGTNFVGGSNELKDLVTAIDQDKVQRMTSNKGVTWKWNPPDGPHFGGVFESMIKSAKRAIAAILGDAEVNDEELETIFVGVESLLNSRPLTTVSDDPNDGLVLTPNHFLIGQMGGDFVPESVDSTPFNLRKRWRRVQELTRHVWQRWMREYLPHIGSRPKWFFPVDNIQVGDVVIVIDPNAARRDWKVGRIEQTYPGPDGLVRVVYVRVKDKVLKRSLESLHWRFSNMTFETQILMDLFLKLRAFANMNSFSYDFFEFQIPLLFGRGRLL